MPRTCTICQHPERAAIDKALVDGQPYRYIAKHFGTSVAALQRHKEDHLRDLVREAKQRQTAHEAALGAAVQEQEAAKVEQAQALLERAQELRRRSIAVHDKAHGSAIERERERLLATGNCGARRYAMRVLDGLSP